LEAKRVGRQFADFAATTRAGSAERKLEIRMPKSETNPNFKKPKFQNPSPQRISCFEPFVLPRISSLLRISRLESLRD